MFGRRAPAPCDNWLGPRAYNDDKSITRIDWVDQQFEQLLHANKRAQKNIKATNAKNRKAAGGKCRHSRRCLLGFLALYTFFWFPEFSGYHQWQQKSQ